MKNIHEEKYKENNYNVSSEILEIVKVSLNTDEYSLERVHNFLKLSNTLKDRKTIDLWDKKFEYIFTWLNISLPLKNYEKLILSEIFKKILQIKPNTKKFEDLHNLLQFL